MFYQEDLLGAEELLGDNERAEGFAGGAAGVADYVGVAEGDAEGGGGVDAGVHAGHDCILFCGWEGKVSL